MYYSLVPRLLMLSGVLSVFVNSELINANHISRIDTSASCTPGCSNCSIMVECINDEPQYTKCATGLVCNEDPTLSCVDVATVSACSCNGKIDGNYPDPYYPQNYYTCVAGNEFFETCASNEVFSPSKGLCMALPACTSLACFPVPEDCHYYYCCLQSGSDYTYLYETCTITNQVYDEVTKGCVDPAAFTCTTAGTVADPTKCDLYHVCASPTDNNPQSFCCPIGEIYDQSTFTCVPDDGSCQNVGICYDEYWETSTCEKCTAVGEVYPSKSQCSRSYYECVKSGANIVAQIVECSGDLIFNPTALYCDFFYNVDGCF